MSTNNSWNRKDLVGTYELSKQEIQTLFAAATPFKKLLSQKGATHPSLANRMVANLFLEPSTRTQMAFDAAARRLNAASTTLNGSASSLTKGESLRDTALNLQALDVDIIVMRHSSPGAAHFVSKIVDIPVINAGDGAHEHPTQALLDCFTLHEHFNGDLAGKEIVIVGDILHSRVARSNIWALKTLGASVTLVGPAPLVPQGFRHFGITISHDLKSAVSQANAVIMLRVQRERQKGNNIPSLGEYTKQFALTQERLCWLKPEAIILHPGPINRGVEIDAHVADSPRTKILEQVTNGIAIRMAALHLCHAHVHGKNGMETLPQ